MAEQEAPPDIVQPLLDDIRHEAQARARAESVGRRNSRRWLVPAIVVNVLLIASVLGAVLAFGSHFRRRAEESARIESRFVTTEWRILQELQNRTDRVLEEKDREIALLRQLRAAIQDRPELQVEAERIDAQLRQAYAQRETILQARISIPDEGSGELDVDLAEAAEPVVAAEDIEEFEDAAPGVEATLDREPEDVDEATISRDDPRTLAWYRRIIDELRLGMTAAAQQRLEALSEGSSLLTPADYDRLLGLTTIVERQRTFIAVVDSLEQQLTERQDELRRTRARLSAALADLSGAEAEVARLEESIRLARANGITEAGLQAARDEADALRREIRRLEALVDDERAAQSGLRRALGERDTAITSLRRRMEALRSDLEASRRESAELEREIDDVLDELASERTALAAARSEIAAAQDEISRLRVNEVEEKNAAARRATDATYSLAESLLDYLAGVEMGSVENARDELLDAWTHGERFRELVTRAERLAQSGVADRRGDLPSSRLVGIITEANRPTTLAEVLTDVDVARGDRVEIRSRDGVQPGALLSTGLVEQIAGDLLVLSLDPAGATFSPRDLVYTVVGAPTPSTP